MLDREMMILKQHQSDSEGHQGMSRQLCTGSPTAEHNASITMCLCGMTNGLAMGASDGSLWQSSSRCEQ